MLDQRARAAQFRDDVQQKIEALLQEFGDGKVSREQFHMLYNRYNNQLLIANEALDGSGMDDFKQVQNALPTFALRQATSGKALGLVIYHHRSGMLVETLGTFEVPASQLAPILNEISHKILAREFIEPQWIKISNHEWLLFTSKQHSSVITLFQNEPARVQIREMARLHHDFEETNHLLLAREVVDADRLAYPFLVFIQNKLKQ